MIRSISCRNWTNPSPAHRVHEPVGGPDRNRTDDHADDPVDDNVYLDNAATTWPKPEPVYRLMDRFSRDIGVNPGRGGHALAADADRLVRQTRRLLAALFGHAGSPDRVVFTTNGTEALNVALTGLLAGAGALSGARAHGQAGARTGGTPGRVVTTGLEHNAVWRTLNHLARDHGLRVEHVAPDRDGYIDPALVDAALEQPAAVLVVNHASNVIGTVQPIEAIGAVARRRGVPLVVDAAQSAGVLPIDMAACGIDVLTFPGHKGLFGPMGSGGLIVAEGHELPPLRFGGTGVDSASPFQPDVWPFRLEAGTLAAPAIAGLFAAQLWLAALGRTLLERVPAPHEPLGVPDGIEAALERAEGIDAADHAQACRRAMRHLHAVEMSHLTALERVLVRHPSVRVLGGARTGERVATLCFVVDGMAADEIAERLDADHGICCRAGLHCAPMAHDALHTTALGGAVRLSPGYFTRASDIERFAAGLDEILGGPSAG